jgi:uncharacterized protein (TIGR02453 family)
MTTPPSTHFTPATFRFLRALKRHNTREWFADHKDQFLADVEAPMLRFITDFSSRLKTISKAYVADPRRTGGSMFRIYRDTRFSADKSPFKTWVAARFPHETSRKAENVPAFYLRLSPGEGVGGGGLYHVEQPALTRVREQIVAKPKAWAAVLKTGIEIRGDRLKRAPAGFDASHRYVEDLMRKQFFTLTTFTEADVTAPDFLDRYMEACQRAAPLIQFLTTALGLRW